MGTHKAHGNPTKDFFVYTITKDVAIEDCILDLLDNAIDGAQKIISKKNPQITRIDDYSGYSANLILDSANFSIKDNCGGISISEAIDYAFHFGRRTDAPSDGPYSIGLYGIGMKRAIFKLGQEILIYSSTSTEAFKAKINVHDWLAKGPDDWDFDLEDAEPATIPGTQISISTLTSTAASTFGLSAFRSSLARIIGRDYFQFLKKGFHISIGGSEVPAYAFNIRENAEFKPAHITYDDGDVTVEIVAGMASTPPDDLEPSESLPETDYFGWFVLCNDRVVLPSDKSVKTIWGNDGFPVWHPQYNGFLGMVSFHSRDAKLLPWTTTKRDLDQTSPVFRRAVVKMKEATRSWLAYTNDRRIDLDQAKAHEAQAPSRAIFEATASAKATFPGSAVATKPTATINYRKLLDEVKLVKAALGNANMSNRDVGLKTFDYYLRNEVGE